MNSYTYTYICFLLFLSRFISFKSVGKKEMTTLHSFLAFWQLLKEKGITKYVKQQ